MKVGETATFRCVGSGIPTPTVEWYDEFSNLLTTGTTLTRENVQSTRRNPTFICIVSSDAGMARRAVKLTVYGKLRIKLGIIYSLDYLQIQHTLSGFQLMICIQHIYCMGGLGAR